MDTISVIVTIPRTNSVPTPEAMARDVESFIYRYVEQFNAPFWGFKSAFTDAKVEPFVEVDFEKRWSNKVMYGRDATVVMNGITYRATEDAGGCSPLPYDTWEQHRDGCWEPVPVHPVWTPVFHEKGSLISFKGRVYVCTSGVGCKPSSDSYFDPDEKVSAPWGGPSNHSPCWTLAK